MASPPAPCPSGDRPSPLRICLVSDFFYPNMGGVESHLFQLAIRLTQQGHRVVVVTHYYGNRVGIRHMTGALKRDRGTTVKVYYLPVVPFYNKSALPTIICSVPLFRYIFKAESIQIVHGHSAFSTLAHEALFIGSMFGLGAVFTDHSLFGFADASAVVTNTFLKYSLANTDHCICVSHTGKENTVLRSDVSKTKVSVIPNAVDPDVFRPAVARLPPRERADRTVTVAIGSRLVYRKGVDLVVAVIPRVCARAFGPGGRFKVDFLIGGDGPKRILFEEMIEQCNLQERVVMLGELKHAEVRDRLLVQGDVFLNTSLTEAFCMAILEAVACGLTVVSTKVGGVPEVLPERFIYFCEPDPADIESRLCAAVEDVIAGRRPSAAQCHHFVRQSYSWGEVAARTERVYQAIAADRVAGGPPTLARRVRNLWERGRVAGPLMAALYLLCHYYVKFMDCVSPVRELNRNNERDRRKQP